MSRDSLSTVYKNQTYRSQTEARWAIFFEVIGISFSYEPEQFTLSNGSLYTPDFYLLDFSAYFEVKPNSEEIVTEECIKARCLSKDRPGQRVWLTLGGPAPNTPNILPLEIWKENVSIDSILQDPKNRYWFHEDRRDERVYWLHSEMHHGFEIGGPGQSTFHEREPLNHRQVAIAYKMACEFKFE